MKFVSALKEATALTNNTFAEILKERRLSLGISVATIASKMGITKVYYTNLEKGYMVPPKKKETIDKLADILLLVGEDRKQFIAASCYARKVLPEELCDYVYLEVPAVIEILKTARENSISNEYFEKILNEMRI